MSFTNTYLELEKKQKEDNKFKDRCTSLISNQAETHFSFISKEIESFFSLFKEQQTGMFVKVKYSKNVYIEIYESPNSCILSVELLLEKSGSNSWFVIKGLQLARIYSESNKDVILSILCGKTVEFLYKNSEIILASIEKFKEESLDLLTSEHNVRQTCSQNETKMSLIILKMSELYLQKIETDGTLLPFFNLKEVISGKYDQESQKYSLIGTSLSGKEVTMSVRPEKIREYFTKTLFRTHKDLILKDLSKIELKEKIAYL